MESVIVVNSIVMLLVVASWLKSARLKRENKWLRQINATLEQSRIEGMTDNELREERLSNSVRLINGMWWREADRLEAQYQAIKNEQERRRGLA